MKKNRDCLIIENEHYLSDSISSGLESIGLSSTILSSTKDIHLVDINYSIIIISSNLENERNFLKTIKRFKNSIIILLTSSINSEFISKVFKYGVDDYILKPFVMDSLKHRVSLLQKTTILKKSANNYLNFIDKILENKVSESFNLNIKLPLIIYSENINYIDLFVSEYVKSKNLYIEIVELNEIKNMDFDSKKIYYIRQFTDINNIYENIRKKKSCNIILGGTKIVTNYKKDFFYFYEIISQNSKCQCKNILTIADYTKETIIKYQNSMTDTELSKKLGISRKSLWDKRKKFNIKKNGGRNKI